jgi:hypothetical protein
MAEFEPYLESLCVGQIPVKITICVFRFFEIAGHVNHALDHLEILAGPPDRPKPRKSLQPM